MCIRDSAYIVSEVQKAIIAQTASKGFMTNNLDAVEKVQKQVSAFTKAAMLDMDYVITIYLEASEAKRCEEIRKIANEFDNKVAKVVETVASASTELSVTARSVSYTHLDVYKRQVPHRPKLLHPQKN